MKRTLLSTLRQGTSFYVLTPCLILGFGLFGTILFEVTMRVSVTAESHLETPTTFEMAFLMSMMGFAAFVFLFAMQYMQRQFNNAVGMSRTRREFFIGSLLCASLSAVLGIVSLYVVAWTEQLRLRYWWGGYPCETGFLVSFTPPVIIFFMLAVIVLSQFIGVLFLRFGKLVFWVLWTFWMLGAILIPRIIDDVEEDRQTTFSGIGHAVVRIVSSLPLFAWLLIGTVVLAGLLVISYRMLMRQQVT